MKKQLLSLSLAFLLALSEFVFPLPVAAAPVTFRVITEEDAASLPKESISQPEVSTSQPEEAASQPEEAASQPEEAASQPEEAASQPEEPAAQEAAASGRAGEGAGLSSQEQGRYLRFTVASLLVSLLLAVVLGGFLRIIQKIRT